MRDLDPVEKDYIRAIDTARSPDEAYELVVGLRQYREMFKARSVVEGEVKVVLRRENS
jgi:hypothetical protein